MPFSPLLPGTSPLPDPRGYPPARRSLRVGAITALVTLVALIAAGIPLLPQLAFVVPMLQAQVESGTGASAGKMFQGFVYPWSRAQQGGGYTTTGSAQNLTSEASIFHMNAVIIPVIADMRQRDNSTLLWHASDGGDVDTLTDSDYLQAIKDARAAGLLPILELEVRQYDTNLSGSVTGPKWVGFAWFGLSSKEGFSLNNSSTSPVPIEAAWFDNYTAFAVHYATLSAQQHLPYFIIGDSLMDVSYDTPETTSKADPAGVPNIPGENVGKCSGRRDCEWRQVIYAIRNSAYSTIVGHSVHQGASYTGKLIYMAGWGTDGNLNHQESKPEFEQITWWNAVDLIGIDAYFPLTVNDPDPTVSDLLAAWQGTSPASQSTGQGDIIQRIQTVSSTYQRPVVLTAGYESALGDNSSPGNPPSTIADQNEQLDDMQGLVKAFTGQSWWAGVFWSADEPIAPRSAQPGWATSSNWAGDTLAKSKAAGQWLAQYYHPLPLGN